MSLTKNEVEKLVQLGFKRASYADEVYPQDIFQYEGSSWVIGGRIMPDSTLLSAEAIYKEGTWIPSLEDLLTWFEDNDYLFEMGYIGNGYKIKAVDVNGCEYKAKGSTPIFVCYHVLLKILEKQGGQLKPKTYEVDEVEIIDRKDLS
ncbi:hypothetical protein [Paenibacillus sp. MMS18-CY102]|uniref:hypothetical protein n=1 Tax=Paenibacillus sp. MMS18-CY102 TaxID=2682849 RepID=UPI001365196F|nr:hypothetical protein [Paenibacillus sp. MMS18-CY102]MWC27345.1 hypothetical protein [Paenibacillus sp. MMS18-CY102]